MPVDSITRFYRCGSCYGIGVCYIQAEAERLEKGLDAAYPRHEYIVRRTSISALLLRKLLLTEAFVQLMHMHDNVYH